MEYYNKQDILKEEKSCDETLHAKDQYIAKLEKEKVDMETETNKLVSTFKATLKLFLFVITGTTHSKCHLPKTFYNGHFGDFMYMYFYFRHFIFIFNAFLTK